MRSNKWTAPIAALLPLLAGIAFSFFAQQIWNPVPLLVFKIDVGMVAFFSGLFCSLLIFLYLSGVWFTQRKAKRSIEETVRESEEGRRRFIRRLDHEIKNPLTGLRAALVNLQEARSKEERIGAAENASRAVVRLTRLLTDLRKLSDLEERSIEYASVDVAELLNDVVETARAIPAYEGRNINLLVSKVPSPFPTVTGDRDLLLLAVYNLVDNALKFTAVGEPVEVRALEDGKAIVVEVADSGAGIPSDDLPRIFDELYRGSNARGTDGSGLGLALVNRIVTLHGGQLEVRSRHQNPHGTVFTVRLPEGK